MAIFWGSPEARTHRGTAAELDTVDYTDSTASVHIDLAATVVPGQRSPIFGGYAEGDRYVSIEGFWGSQFADTILGDGLANGLFGYGGNDSLTGGAGNDTLRGEGGSDTVSGGAGDDVVYGDDDADEVYGDEGADALFGGMGTDTVDGGAGRDTLYGGKGNDVLIGGSGGAGPMGEGDVLEGGAGADTLYGDGAKKNDDGEITGPGDWEIFQVPAGHPVRIPLTDSVTVAAVYDVASYTLSNTGVVVDLNGFYEGGKYSTRRDVVSTPADATTTPATPQKTTSMVTLKEAAGGHAAGDVLYGIVGVRGSAHDDTLVGLDRFGDGGHNQLYGNQGNDLLIDFRGRSLLHGGKGNDTLQGGNHDDTLEGGAGADSIVGGGNYDFASYANSNASVSVDMTKIGTPNPAQSGGHAEGDTLAEIESVIGSNFGDLLIGNDGTNWWHNNRLLGLGGDDWDNPNTVGADAGALDANGTRTAAARGGLFGGSGNDLLDGGDGNDLLAGEAGADTLQGGAGNDYLHGGADSDTLDGGAGNDTLTGGAGNDSVSGGDGNDTFLWEDGTDTLSGGAGVDTLDASAHTAAIGASGAPYTLPAEIEGFIGTSMADHIQGQTAAVNNHFFGGPGNDELAGGPGNDTLSGGLGADLLVGGAGNDTYVIALETGDTATTGRTATAAGVVKNTIGVFGAADNEFSVGDKIDIRALGVTAAELATLLRTQGRTTTKNLDFGTGKGWLEVRVPQSLAELTMDDFII